MCSLSKRAVPLVPINMQSTRIPLSINCSAVSCHTTSKKNVNCWLNASDLQIKRNLQGLEIIPAAALSRNQFSGWSNMVSHGSVQVPGGLTPKKK